MPYKVEELSYSRQSPYFEEAVLKHRRQLRVADDFLGNVEACSTELISAMHAVGIASRNLGQCLACTPAIFSVGNAVSALSTVLSELSSAEEVLAESLELAVAKQIISFRKELAKFDELRRISDRADTEALAAVELLLHGDWVRVERDIQKQQRKGAARRAIQSPPPPGNSRVSGGEMNKDASPQSESLVAVVEERVKVAAEKRRIAELRRFDLCRYVSSIQRRKGLVLAQISVATLCSLRAFLSQVNSFAISDAANAAHFEQTEIEKMNDREREPWDLRMQRLQRILNQPEVDHNLFVTNPSKPLVQSTSMVTLDEAASTTKSILKINELLESAEERHRVYAIDRDLEALYDDKCQSEKRTKNRLEGYLFSQPIASSGGGRRTLPSNNWTRRWFSLDERSLTARRIAPGWGGQLLRGVLAREASSGGHSSGGEEIWGGNDSSNNAEYSLSNILTSTTKEVDQNDSTSDNEDEELVAELLLSSVRACTEDRCAFFVHSARGQAYKLQAFGREECERWINAFRNGVEKQLQRPSSNSLLQIPLPLQRTPPVSNAVSNQIVGSPSSLYLLENDHETAKLVEAEECARLIAQIEKQNTKCADCGSLNPEWVSINLGLVVCVVCSGVHRSLGTHLSKVRSLKLDRLSPLELLLISQIGNAKANAIFESRLLDHQQKCKPESDARTRANYIRAKYRDRSYVTPILTSAGISSQHLMNAAESNDLQAALSIVTSPNTNIDHRSNEGSTTLHVAARNALPAFCQLLVVNGASITCQDQSGRTPIDHFFLSNAWVNAQHDSKVLPEGGNEDNKRHLVYLSRLLSPVVDNNRSTSPSRGDLSSPVGSTSSLCSF